MNGFTISLLRPGIDAVRLQQLLDECSDYYLLHEGCPTPADAGEFELSAVPDGRSADELRVFGMEGPGGGLVAVAMVLPDYPAPGVWWIGLLVVTPALRSRGVGAQLLQHVAAAMSAAGGEALQLIVSLNNPRGQRFWQAAGFRDTGQVRRVEARSGHIEEGRILVRDEEKSEALASGRCHTRSK